MSRVPFQLLELNIISAQDLSPVSKKSQTYAIIWLSPERKLRTRIDPKGKNNPTWNDKFIFRVDDEFLDSNESTVNIELYASGWIKDIPVGSVEVSITNLIPQSIRTTMASTTHIVALQIRRPSGRPQGIFNMGVTLLDNTMRSMPLYTEVKNSDLNSEDLRDSKMFKQQAHRICKEPKLGQECKEIEAKKIRLERSQSDVSDLTTKENAGINMNAPSAINMTNSAVYGSSINGSALNGFEAGNGSVCNSDVGPSPSVVAVAVARGLILTPIGVPRNTGSSILADWKAEQSSVEELKTKIERWRTEYPALNGPQNNNSQKIEKSSMRQHSSSSTILRRSKTDGGLFRCFGNAYGFEISIVCGGGNNNNRRKKGRIANRSCDSASSMLRRTT